MINEAISRPLCSSVPQVHRSNEDSESYDDLKPLRQGQRKTDFVGKLEALDIKTSSKSSQISQVGGKGEYKRTLSGGLKSPRADVPKKAILQRINSKKIANSYQLGHQLSLKWTTGAGPRIGCVADYPVELRVQALELVNLSPRSPPTPSKRMSLGFSTPTTPTKGTFNGGNGSMMLS